MCPRTLVVKRILFVTILELPSRLFDLRFRLISSRVRPEELGQELAHELLL